MRDSVVQKADEESRMLDGEAVPSHDALDLDFLKKYAPVEPKPAGSFYQNWGIQAFYDYLFGMHYFKQLALCVPRTLVPILKLCADNREEIDALYEQVKGYNEKTHFYNSPRERWRKFYGNMIREIEWCCFELRKYFTKSAYEELIICSAADYIVDIMSGALSFVEKIACIGNDHKEFIPDWLNNIINKLTKIIFEKFINIGGFLIGHTRVPEFDFREGNMIMEVTDCLMLRAPRMKDFPEECCLLVCKGACEKAFEKYRTSMLFDPGLPEATCEIRYFADQEEDEC